MLWNFGHCFEWSLFCTVFYGSPCHRNDTVYDRWTSDWRMRSGYKFTDTFETARTSFYRHFSARRHLPTSRTCDTPLYCSLWFSLLHTLSVVDYFWKKRTQISYAAFHGGSDHFYLNQDPHFQYENIPVKLLFVTKLGDSCKSKPTFKQSILTNIRL